MPRGRKQENFRRKPRWDYSGTQLLSNLPGFKLNNTQFTELTGVRIDNGSQTQYTKTISSQLQDRQKLRRGNAGTELQNRQNNKKQLPKNKTDRSLAEIRQGPNFYANFQVLISITKTSLK